ncbi:MAG TPA: hypothetical protein VGD77_00385 [Gemmatimonadaceae bacterium]
MRRRRTGIALLIALLTLVALAGAVTASFFPAREGQRIGERAARLELLAGEAELGLWVGLQSLTPELLAAHRDPGVLLDRALDVTAGGRRVHLAMRATRLPGGAAWLASRATFPSGGEQRGRHLVLVEQRPTFPSSAAVVARVAPAADPDFILSGADEPPPGWSGCDPPRPAGDAVLLTQAADAFRRFGNDSLASLLGRAVPPVPGIVGGALVVLPSGATLGPGTGSGVVIATGPVHIAGPLDFAGVIVALDSLTAAPNVNLHGLLLAVGQAPARLEGPGAIRRSECAVRRAEGALAHMTAGPWSWGISY